MSQEIDIVALREAILGGQVSGEKPHIQREKLKKLVNSNKWERIGFLFGFKPVYMQIGGTNVFDWTSCNQSFWDIFSQPPLPPLAVTNLVSSRSEHEFKKEKRVKSGNGHRERLWVSQQGICHYCKQKVGYNRFTVDHIVARSKGGGNSIGNKVGACSSCNNAKGALTQEEFLASNYLAMKLKFAQAKAAIVVVQQGTIAA